MKYEKHVFVCINEKSNGKKCCEAKQGLESVKILKEMIAGKGLKGKIRINKSGCLDACAYGPAMVVYPEGVWYGGIKHNELSRIVEEHLINDQPIYDWDINFEETAKKYLKSRLNKAMD